MTMQSWLFVSTLVLSCLSQPTSEGTHLSISSTLSILSDTTGNPIKSIIFSKISHWDDKIDVIWQMDKYLYKYLIGCLKNLDYPGHHQKFKDFMLYSSEISISFMKLLNIQRYIQENPQLYTGKLLAESMLRKLLEVNPLQGIRNILVQNASDTISFAEEYQKFMDMCLQDMSELQHMTILLQHLRWMMTKLHEMVKLAEHMHFDFEDAVSSDEVMIGILREYSKMNIIKIHDNILERFREYLTRASSAVLFKDFHKYIINETYYEIMIFRRMFVEKCHDPPALLTFSEREKMCSRITSAPKYCDALDPGKLCPVWQTCGKISCRRLKEETTVCKSNEKLTGVRQYEYYTPSHRKNTRGCTEFYWLQHEKRVANWGIAHAICTPCECICQKKNEPYYYSTEMVITDTQDNMVVVGAKFVLLEDTLFIQVRQGKLLSNGIIDPDTIEWLPLTLGSREEISLDEKNAVDLTRVEVPQGEVITGLSLTREHSNSSRDHRIQLSVSTNKYNFGEGTLSANEEIYFSSRARSEVKDDEVISSLTESSDMIVRNETVRFTVSGGQNGGRITLPLFDGRKVIPDPPTPLSGAGLYLRRKNNGSFIGIELLTFNVSSLLLNQIS